MTHPMDLAGLRDQIERAFDGVPAPGAGHRTLYQAEAADDYGRVDQSRDHKGRWQDLPFEQLADCQWALPHLDGVGVLYYTPAIMLAQLNWLESEDEALCLHLFTSLEFTLTPEGSYELRDYARMRLSGFDPEQRRAVLAYVLATADAHTGAELHAAWTKVVAHDESNAESPWFGVFWPERLRPEAPDVIDCIVRAFPVDPAAPWTDLPITDQRSTTLPDATPEQFCHLLPAYAVFILGNPQNGLTEDLLREVQRALHPQWGQDTQPLIRERLGALTPGQRTAVAAFADAAIDNTSMRAMWRRAAANPGPDWFEYLKLP